MDMVGRPLKDPALKKSTDLKIPVSATQKQLIDSALAGREFAGWARDLILKSAQELLEQRKRKRGPKAP
jgi:hypothetical protein